MRRKTTRDPHEALDAELPVGLPERAARAGLAAWCDDDGHLMETRADISESIRVLFKSEREARPVIDAVAHAVAAPEVGRMRESVIRTVLSLLDDIEGDVADWKSMNRAESAKLFAWAAAAEVTLSAIGEWSQRCTGLGPTGGMLRALRATWLSHAKRLRSEGNIAARGAGRPSPILTRDKALRVLRACGLPDRPARRLIRAAQE